jgi:hypothetical protein
LNARVRIKDVTVEESLDRHTEYVVLKATSQQACWCQAGGSTDKMKHRMKVKVGG